MGDGLAGLVVNGILDGPVAYEPEAHDPDAFGIENGSGSTEVQGIFEGLGRAVLHGSLLMEQLGLNHVMSWIPLGKEMSLRDISLLEYLLSQMLTSLLTFI